MVMPLISGGIAGIPMSSCQEAWIEGDSKSKASS